MHHESQPFSAYLSAPFLPVGGMISFANPNNLDKLGGGQSWLLGLFLNVRSNRN